MHVFQGADLRCGEVGLSAIAKNSRKVSINDLSPGELVVFVNSAKTMVKVMAHTGFGHVVAHHRSPSGRIELTALRHIPKAFNGGVMNYNKALEAALLEMLPPRRRGNA